MIFFLFTVITMSNLHAQTPNDSVMIKATLMNYALGWFEGQPERMEKALYHDFSKRQISMDETGKTKLSGHTAMSMFQGTRNRSNKAISHEEAINKIKEITIFLIYDQIASAVIKSDNWTDFVLLANIDGEWKMMDVIWQRPTTD